MDKKSEYHKAYSVEDWADVEHCVYHALVDSPKDLTDHRIAHFASRIAATLVEKEILTTGELESFLVSCRG